MATLTFTADDGAVQTFDLGVLSVPGAPVEITEVKVEESDGSEETFVPETPTA